MYNISDLHIVFESNTILPMVVRDQLRTVRFSTDEAKQVDHYLKTNPLFESFSSLARVSTLQFIQDKTNLALQTSKHHRRSHKCPSFLWDYDMTETEIFEILALSGYPPKKRWLIERILTQATFTEVWHYLSVDQIRAALPLLRLKSKIRERWEYALDRWGQHA